MWDIEFTDEREVVYSKIKNGKKHIINKFWDEDQGVCWWHVYIVDPETPYTECTDNDFKPNYRRITALPDDEWDTSYWEESETVADVINRIKSFRYADKKFYIYKGNELIESFKVQFKESGDLYSCDVEKILDAEIDGWVFGKGGVEIWLA